MYKFVQCTAHGVAGPPAFNGSINIFQKIHCGQRRVVDDPTTDKVVVKRFSKFRGKIVEARIMQNEARDIIR